MCLCSFIVMKCLFFIESQARFALYDLSIWGDTKWTMTSVYDVISEEYAIPESGSSEVIISVVSGDMLPDLIMQV